MALTTSIQTGSETIAATDGVTIDVTISSVTAANSVVMFNMTGGETSAGSRPLRHLFTPELTSATNLRFTRNASSAARTCTIQWYVIEFDSSAYSSIQKGTVTATGDPEDVTVTSLTAADASIIHFLETDLIGFQPEMSTMAELTSATNLRFDIGASPGTDDCYISWQVIEWDTANIGSVQNGTIALSAAEENDTATITSVDTSKTAIFHQGGVSPVVTAAIGRARSRVVLTNGTTVTADRNSHGTSTTMDVSYSAVEFTNESVVAGSSNFTTLETSENPTFTEVGSDHAVVGTVSVCNGAPTGGDATNSDEVFFNQVVSSPPDDLTISRESGGTGLEVDVAYTIIDFTDSGTSVSGNTISSGSTVAAPSVAITVLAAFIASGLSVTVPAVQPVVDGATISSSSTVAAPTVHQTITTATISTGATVTAPTVTESGAVAGATITSGSTVATPSVAVTITSGTITSSHTTAAPTVAPDQAISSTHISSGASINAPNVGHTVTAATISSSSTATVPSVTQTITTATVPTSVTTYPPIVAGDQSVTGNTIASTLTLYAPSVFINTLPPITDATTEQVIVARHTQSVIVSRTTERV